MKSSQNTSQTTPRCVLINFGSNNFNLKVQIFSIASKVNSGIIGPENSGNLPALSGRSVKVLHLKKTLLYSLWYLSATLIQ
jgi:hypothetical protein